MITKIENLKGKLSKFETMDILGYIATRFITFAGSGEEFSTNSDIFKKTELDSPYRQYMYLAGLLMSTDYVGDTLEDTNQSVNYEIEDHDKNISKYYEIESELKEITDQYFKFFIPEDLSLDELQSLSDLEKRKRMVTMQTFMSYFSSDILRYEEQIINRMKVFGNPFDEILNNNEGITVSDLIGFYNFVNSSFNKSIERSKSSGSNFYYHYEELMKQLDKIQDIDEKYDDLLAGSEKVSLGTFYDGIQNLFLVSRGSIIEKFGSQKAEKLLSVTSLERKSRKFQYYNSDNPFVKKPLCRVADDKYLIVHPKIVLASLYDYLINTLEALDKKNVIKFYEKRGDITENITMNYFKSIFGEEANYYTSVCEVPKSEEHDLLIRYKDRLLIIEIKSSKVKEPMFNPDKAYTRIKDHFNSKAGIGGGYKQAKKLKEFIISADKVTLYHNMTEPFTLKKADYTEIYLVVITLEQFGPANINMSQLLDEDNLSEYPWSCNLYDLENLIQMLKYMKVTASDFLKYIDWRITKHSKIISSDELEILEVYYSSENIREHEEMIFIPMLEYTLVDKIYFDKHGIYYYHPNFSNTAKAIKQKAGRNELCPCGSGKKYKKCCLD